LRFVNGLFSN